ncbi:lactate utilization protein C [Desulfotomaculum defluvii]
MAQLGISEQEFLTQVATALGRDIPLTERPERQEIGPPAFWREDEDIKHKALELFKNNLEALSGRVVLVKNPEEVCRQVNTWLAELNAKQVICWDHEELKRILPPEALQAKVRFWNGDNSREQLIEQAAQADVGITWVNYAIAYTGTMAVFSGPTTGRSVSLLPPTHIGIFKRSSLVPTMSHVVRYLVELKGNNKLPTAVNFITGPSRTSDIEMDLSIGVHGPYRTWTIILEDK